MKYLIAGRNGQLAQAFIRSFERGSIEFTAPDESQLDIRNGRAVEEIIAAYKPDVVLNCAAYNLVDLAEQEQEKAFGVNAMGAKNLAEAAARVKAILVHFGTDYVFDGMKECGLYTEEDRVNPLNNYGKSKLLGEELVRKTLDDVLIFRLSWVYGNGMQNFIYKFSEWSRNNEYLKIACDEFSVPTYTDTVVKLTLQSLDTGLRGLFHLTSSGFCSRYEWATFIAKCLGMIKFIRPVSMDVFHLPARRPKFSAMSNHRLARELNVSIPTWEEAVESFVRARRLES